MMYLVTGGAGFIGSHIADALLKKGVGVRVLDDLSTGRMQNIEHLLEHSNFSFVKGDVRDFDLLFSSCEGVSGIFHEAGFVSAAKSVAVPDVSFSINCGGGINVFEAARRHSIPKVVFASSAAVYGDNMNLPLGEDEASSALSPYALEKSYLEQLGALYWRLYGISSCALRYFNVYGPRQDPGSPYSGVISSFVHALVNDDVPRIDGDGEQTRDFVYVMDVVEANLLAMQSAQANGFQVFNVGTGKQCSIKGLLQILTRFCHSGVQPTFASARQGDVRLSVADISKIGSALGYSPSWTLEQGLLELLRDSKS